MDRCVKVVNSKIFSACEEIYVHPAGDYISDIISYQQDFYECGHLAQFSDFLKSEISGRPGTFIDVGCNIGNHSLFLNSTINFQNMVLVDISEKNCILASKNNPQAVVINSAASDVNGSGEVYLYDDNSGVGTVTDKPILWVEMHSDDILKRNFEYIQKDIFDFLSMFDYKLIGKGGGNYIFKCAKPDCLLHQ